MIVGATNVVRIVKKARKGNQYFYLEHTVRESGKVRKREKYLGKTIPENINDIIDNFYYEIYIEKWDDQLKRVKTGYTKEISHMPPSAWEKHLNDFMIRFTYNTNRIEGSTLTLRETADLLEEGITPGNKPVDHVKEAEAHKAIFYKMLEEKKDLDLDTILSWHHRLFIDTKFDIAGSIRNTSVAISGSSFVPPPAIELETLLDEFFNWYEKSKAIRHPVVLAALTHLRFVTIHPFVDGNGRISRIIMNHVLHHSGYPMIFIEYRNRRSYYTALERSQTLGQDYIFVRFLVRRYLKYYSRYLK
jgi:Fic family protein